MPHGHVPQLYCTHSVVALLGVLRAIFGSIERRAQAALEAGSSLAFATPELQDLLNSTRCWNCNVPTDLMNPCGHPMCRRCIPIFVRGRSSRQCCAPVCTSLVSADADRLKLNRVATRVLNLATATCNTCYAELNDVAHGDHVSDGNCTFVVCPCSADRMTMKEFAGHSFLVKRRGCFRFFGSTIEDATSRFVSLLPHFKDAFVGETCLRIIAPPQGTPSPFEPCPVCMTTVYEDPSAATIAQFPWCEHSTCVRCFERIRSAAAALDNDMRCPMCRHANPEGQFTRNKFMESMIDSAPRECTRTGMPVRNVAAHRETCDAEVECVADGRKMPFRELKAHIFGYNSDGVFNGCVQCITGGRACTQCVPAPVAGPSRAGPSGSRSPRGRADADEARPRSPRSPRGGAEEVVDV